MKFPKIIKILAIFLILGAGLVGSYFIVKDSVSVINFINKEDLKKEDLNNDINNKLLIEKPLRSLGDDNLSGNLPEGPIQGNLTEIIGQGIFEKIQPFVDLNQGPSFKDLNSISKSLIDDFLKKSSADLNLISDVDNSQLKISPDNSREAKIKYLKAIGEINKKNLGDFNKSYLEIIIDVYQKLDPTSASRLANIYKNLAVDYLDTAAPSDWLDFHKEIIIHFKNSEIIYSLMASYINEVDLIGGLFALDLIEKMAIDNAQAIQFLLDKKIQEVNLEL